MNYMDYLEKMTKMVCDSMKVKKVESAIKLDDEDLEVMYQEYKEKQGVKE